MPPAGAAFGGYELMFTLGKRHKCSSPCAPREANQARAVLTSPASRERSFAQRSGEGKSTKHNTRPLRLAALATSRERLKSAQSNLLLHCTQKRRICHSKRDVRAFALFVSALIPAPYRINGEVRTANRPVWVDRRLHRTTQGPAVTKREPRRMALARANALIAPKDLF